MALPATSDVEGTSTLADLLAAVSVPEKELNSPAVKSYLTHLSSLPLDTLLTEPGRLATESDILSSDLTQLCHSQHQTFLSLRSASNALSSSLGSLTSSLDTLLNDSIPNLESEARLFSENTKTIQQNRAKASLVLEHHEKLLDVLELPQLLATCIKNGYYSEALDLANHFERNLMSTLPPSTLLESIHTSVVASLQTLLQQLLQQLRAPAKLPVLFKTVNLLRRMEVCSEEQLAMAFILGRSAQLDDTFASANTSRDLEEDPAKWLRKWVEVFREGVYDVITQYSSIFLSTPSSTASPASVTNTMLLRSILSHTTQHYLSQLLSHLQTKLHTIPLGDMSSLASVLTQLSYCASSFARVGMDFRQALVPIVEEAILTIVGKGLASAAETLENTVTLRGNLPPGEWLVDAASAGSLPRRNSAAGGASQIHIPPPSLTHFPPIAQYTNMVLSALNALRLVPAPSIAERALELESESLQRVSAALLTYCKGRGVSSSSEESAYERSQLALIVAAVWHDADGVIPYLSNALVKGVYANYPLTVTHATLKENRKEWVQWAEKAGISADLGAEEESESEESSEEEEDDDDEDEDGDDA